MRLANLQLPRTGFAVAAAGGPETYGISATLDDYLVTRAMRRAAALLLWRLGRDEPHVWPSDRLADRLGVSGIILVPLDCSDES
jgi:hypothetical protein